MVNLQIFRCEPLKLYHFRKFSRNHAQAWCFNTRIRSLTIFPRNKRWLRKQNYLVDILWLYDGWRKQASNIKNKNNRRKLIRSLTKSTSNFIKNLLILITDNFVLVFKTLIILWLNLFWKCSYIKTS